MAVWVAQVTRLYKSISYWFFLLSCSSKSNSPYDFVVSLANFFYEKWQLVAMQLALKLHSILSYIRTGMAYLELAKAVTSFVRFFF